MSTTDRKVDRQMMMEMIDALARRAQNIDLDGMLYRMCHFLIAFVQVEVQKSITERQGPSKDLELFLKEVNEKANDRGVT